MNPIKKTVLTAFLTLCLSVSAFSNSRQTDDWIQRLGVMLIAKQLGIDPDIISSNLGWGQPVYDVAPAYVIYKETRTNPDEIWRYRQQGLGWGEVAHKVGMHPGTFNKLRNAGYFDEGRLWHQWLRDRYGLTDAQIRYLRNQGYSWSDIAGMCHVSYRSGAPVRQVSDRWRNNRNWTQVRTYYKVNDDWSKGNWKGTWTKGTWRGAQSIKSKSSKSKSDKVTRQTWEQRQSLRKVKPGKKSVTGSKKGGKDVRRIHDQGKGSKVVKGKGGKSHVKSGGKGAGKGGGKGKGGKGKG